MVDRFVMGQIMSFDMPDMNKYKYEYLGETGDDVSTYALYVESNKRQIIINIMQESDPKFEEVSQFKGRLVPHHHDKMIYESLVVNLIVDQKKQKTRTTAKHSVVNLKQWYETYHQKPDRGLSLKQYLSDRGVIFSGLAKSIIFYYFNEVLYNKASILQENSKYMEGIMAHLQSQYKTYFRDEREFVAFCKGAAIEKFELLTSYKTHTDVLALRRERKRWYSYTRKQFFSDVLRATILVKVVKIHQANEDLTANLLFSKVSEFYDTVQHEITTSQEKPMAFAMAFGENKVVVKPLEYKPSAETNAQPRTSGEVIEKLNSMCLSPKSRRRRRESMRQQCLFDWEDVDQFNEGKFRDNEKIKIDEEKFLRYLTKVENENKRYQLLDFVEQQGAIRNSKLKHIVSQSKLIQRLSGLSKTSHLVMRSFMLKSVVGDLLSGDFKGFAANVGFIGGSYVMMKLSDNMKTRALKLSLANKATFRSAVKVAAPFVSRLTSAYNIYHLYKSIQAYKNGSSEALLSVINDGTFVLVDTVEIGAELLETFGVVEGLTSVVFPIGTALAAVAMLGTEIYTAYKSFKALKQIDQEIHLTKSEWFVEGFRSLLGMSYHDYLPKLYEAKELNQHLVNAKSILLSKPGIDHNAIGLSRKKTKSGAAYIETGNGIDYVVGLKNYSNIVSMGDGEKYVTTGNESDSFIVQGDTRGTLNGSGGQDFLDLQWLSPKLEKVLITVAEEKTDVLSADKKEPFLTAYNVFDIIMRVSLVFLDKVEIKVKKFKMFAIWTTGTALNAMKYIEDAERLKIIFNIWLTDKNETLLIGHSMEHALTELTITRNNNDVILTLNGIEGDGGATFSLFSIFLESAFDLEWYKKVIVIHHRPMNISYVDGNHSRSQSIRQEYHENGRVSINQHNVEIFPKDCNDLNFSPFELIFDQNVNVIIIQESDIERNITIKIEQSILDFDFVQHDSNLLIFAYKYLFDLDSATVIILKKFFVRYFSNLHTINLKFEDLSFNLMQEMTLKGLVTLDRLVEHEERFFLKMISD
uniref:Uncharacterized protein n=1 Tax=Romanomermis culicivorax TaxID=13658 RepID=A0A915J7D8_ROMCU